MYPHMVNHLFVLQEFVGTQTHVHQGDAAGACGLAQDKQKKRCV